MLRDAYCRRHICNLSCHGLSDRLAERIAFDAANYRAGAGNRCGNYDRVAKAGTKVRNDRRKTACCAATGATAGQTEGRFEIRSHNKINTRFGSCTKTETQVEKNAETESRNNTETKTQDQETHEADTQTGRTKATTATKPKTEIAEA